MKVNVIMPKMGESITEGTVIKWHKKPGDKISKDEILFEISTDKVDTEIPSPEDGILLEIIVQEQETVAVDSVVAVIETESENTSNKENTSEVIEIVMPKMGESVTEGTIIKWHKKAGEEVKADEILFEISTDKVDTEIPAPADGVINEIIVQEQQTVLVGTVLAKLSTKNGIKQIVIKKAKGIETEETKKTETDNTLEKFFSPLVLNIAAKEKIPLAELEKINGTGENGRISKKDVLNYLEKRKAGNVLNTPEIDESKSNYSSENKETYPVQAEKEIEIIPMDNTRKRIMQNMIITRDTSVHVTSVVEVDMTKIYNIIKETKEAFLKKEGIKLTYMPFISYAVIKALLDFPLMNSTIKDEKIYIKKFVNLGIAVAVEPNGLIVPNMKNAEEKSLTGLAKEIADLGARARNKTLLPEEVIDGTFTVTNYGVFGSLFGTPVINQPEVGIIGIGTVTKKAVVLEIEGIDTIAIKPMMYLSLSHDHRLIDGMLGGKFLKKIKEYLENFESKLF
ncbi:MAG: 2-oxoglutarate dehydrogenase [Ignavibacteria bacterium]|nr:2-oxoglutarate dehydrogenase [Ignavibacteria bacterium]